MAAVDLLFQVKPNSERMHQIALSTLLSRTDLGRFLGLQGTPDGDFEWEPEKRLYDLKISLRGRAPIFVEIKTDSTLRPQQVKSQLDRMRKTENEPQLIYILVGATRFVTNEKRLMQMVRAADPEGHSQGRVRYCDTGTLIRALKEVVSESSVPDYRDLAAAYITCLRGLDQAGSTYALLPVSHWGREQHFQFYEQLRSRGITPGAGFDMVPNPRGGFYGCWWGWTSLLGDGGAEAYLQLELGHEDPGDDRFAIKVKVPDGGQQIPIRDAFARALEASPKAAELGLRRPARLGLGTHMTVADLPSDPRALRKGDDMNWDELKSLCGSASRVIEEAVRTYRQNLLGRR